MNSYTPPNRGRRPQAARGHGPHRGGPGGGGGGGRGRGTRGGHRGGGSAPFTPLSDPSRDPELAPQPPELGFFQTSFMENPWFELESKMGIPHLKPVAPSQNKQGAAHSLPEPNNSEAAQEVRPA
ncbi:related to RAY38 protein [Ustilago sp. UG-2017b]|nr:related to RAY38 protein [Ustilago sp. UG-2017b]